MKDSDSTIKQLTRSIIVKTSEILFIVIMTLALTEVGSIVFMKIYRTYRTDTVGSGSSKNPKLAAELSEVQKGVKPSPYRWYKLLPNFHGVFVQTDSSGFRINKQAIDSRQKVGFYGGSTAFSVLTTQNETIPDIMGSMSNNFQFLNFGVGGYSTAAEIMTFVESLRLYPDIKYAIFYDGVNELGRSNDGLVFRANPNYQSEKVLGYTYTDLMELAYRNTRPPLSWDIRDSTFYYIIDKFVVNRSRWLESKREKEHRLKAAAKTYLQNLEIIQSICKAKQIKCIFAWQPNIHTVKQNALSPIEKKIKSSDQWGSTYPRITRIVLRNQYNYNLRIHNISDALDAKDAHVFWDNCHLNGKGNEIIARKLLKAFKQDVGKY